MKLSALYIIIIIVFISALQKVNAQPGTLDESFGEDGKVITKTPGSFDAIRDIKVLEDGSMLATCTDYGVVFLVKYLPEGRIDSTFGIDGISNLNLPGIVSLSDVGQDELGRFVAIGSTSIDFFKSNNIVFRFFADGKLDSSFSSDGFLLDSLGSAENNQKLTLQQDNKIITCGFYIKRYLPDGKTDSSFANDGIQHISATVIALRPDARIILGRHSDWVDDSEQTNFNFIGLTSSGKIDSSFGENGYVETDFYGKNDNPTKILVQPDGKILAGGTTERNEKIFRYFALARYLPDGRLDSLFGEMGKIHTGFDTSEANDLNSLAVKKDGRIVAAGYSWNFNFPLSNMTSFFSVARYLENGSLDSSFGISGTILTSFDSPYNKYSVAYSMAMQKDEKIILAGFSKEPDFEGNSDLCLVRYNAETVLPLTLTSFTATKKENTSLLQWRTCNEINSKGFSIERSANNKTFTSIGFVNARGGSNNCNNNYSFTDNAPLQGTNYYRLQLVDKDGKYSFSDMKNLSFILSSLIKLSPNPVQNILKIEGLDGIKSEELRIMNVAGKLMAAARADQSIYNWHIPFLQPGMYYLVVVNAEGEKQVVKFVKE